MPKAILVPIASALAISAPSTAQTTVTVTKDDTVITESCKVVIPRGTVIADSNGDGVIHIKADNIVVEFADGSVLRGAPEGTPWDQMAGVGIRIDGHKKVAVWNARVQGYKVGMYASGTDSLEVLRADFTDNFRQHLKSTPWAEDASDWLWPHKNDDHEWMKTYGAGLCVERSSEPVISGITVRRGQNGIILDRVSGARLYENNCSYLSGWGLAMWQSSDNRITRNSFNFCIRGYSHGVYNRGQDSAGILCFEQCSNNVFAENSCIHCGDGFFGFAGAEAIGEQPPKDPGFDYTRKGCNDNLLIDNDFSYAAAHGIEMTFSYGNQYVRNFLTENAICGIWAGYSQDSLILMNRFERNGEGAYGLERGGVNIEHGAGNKILQNTFEGNACGVHLWWDDDKGLLEKPGVKANYRAVTGNVVANNGFTGDKVALQLRDAGVGHVKGTVFVGNKLSKVGKENDITSGIELVVTGDVAEMTAPSAGPIAGQRGTRRLEKRFLGLDKTIMDEWGPWDQESLLVRLEARSGAAESYKAYQPPRDLKAGLDGPGLELQQSGTPGRNTPVGYVVSATGPGVFPYTLRFTADRYDRSFTGTIINAAWSVTFFPWGPDADPRKNLEAWRALAKGPSAKIASVSSLNFKFGGGGPSDLKVSDDVSNARFKPDYFGTIATGSLKLPKGRWRVTTMSDDGVRVSVNGKTVIENWTWHGPTKDTGEFTIESDGAAEIVVEHFEIDGYSVLEFGIERAE